MGTRGFSCAVSGVGYVSIVSRLRHSLIGLRPASHEARRENTSGTQGKLTVIDTRNLEGRDHEMSSYVDSN